eukprot:Em0018g1208a
MEYYDEKRNAVLFQILVYCAIIVPPFFVAYFTNDLWQYTSSYREQPEVYYSNQQILQLCDALGTCKTWTSYPSHNLLLQPGEEAFPTIKSKEDDSNRDGINDGLKLTVEFTNLNVSVTSLRLLLFFEIRLSLFSSYVMQSLVYTTQSWSAPTTKLWISGELRLDQRAPLPASGHVTTYNSSLVNSSSVFAKDFDISNILQAYSTRNVTSVLHNVYPVWEPGASTGFTLQVELQYPAQTILYSPGFWQLLKFAWIQYLAIACVFGYVLRHVQEFVFSNQLILTVKRKPHQH